MEYWEEKRGERAHLIKKISKEWLELRCRFFLDVFVFQREDSGQNEFDLKLPACIKILKIELENIYFVFTAQISKIVSINFYLYFIYLA